MRRLVCRDEFEAVSSEIAGAGHPDNAWAPQAGDALAEATYVAVVRGEDGHAVEAEVGHAVLGALTDTLGIEAVQAAANDDDRILRRLLFSDEWLHAAPLNRPGSAP